MLKTKTKIFTDIVYPINKEYIAIEIETFIFKNKLNVQLSIFSFFNGEIKETIPTKTPLFTSFSISEIEVLKQSINIPQDIEDKEDYFHHIATINYIVDKQMFGITSSSELEII